MARFSCDAVVDSIQIGELGRVGADADRSLADGGDRRRQLGFAASRDKDPRAALRELLRRSEPNAALPPVTNATFPWSDVLMFVFPSALTLQRDRVIENGVEIDTLSTMGDNRGVDQILAMRAFARVVEAGNFTRAAESLRTPKATISKAGSAARGAPRRPASSADDTARRHHARWGRLLREERPTAEGARGRRRELLRRAHPPARPPPCRPRLLGREPAPRPALPDFVARYPEIRIDLGVGDRSVDLVGDNVDCVIRGGALAESALVSRTIGRVAWLTWRDARVSRALRNAEAPLAISRKGIGS